VSPACVLLEECLHIRGSVCQCLDETDLDLLVALWVLFSDETDEVSVGDLVTALGELLEELLELGDGEFWTESELVHKDL